MKKTITILLGVLLLASCTQNQRAKQWGGTANVNIQKGQRLIDVTWKGEQIWYLTDDMPSNYTPKTYDFVEESSFGMIEGKVLFIESK